MDKGTLDSQMLLAPERVEINEELKDDLSGDSFRRWRDLVLSVKSREIMELL